ncbi:GFA family protein [Oxalobacteraceae bacterium OM1]|nr:GFA family protein [Oxalobacteraceae bacterium OM1]
MHQGSCLCGAVRYEIDGDIPKITHCHCSMCRKMHGSAFGSYLIVPRSAFRITAGADHIAAYVSSPGVQRTFCRQCGATLQWYEDDPNAVMGVAAGTLDTPLDPPPQKHIFTGSKASWYHIGDDLPRSA